MHDSPLVLGCGALNLDLIYEVDSLKHLRSLGFELEPGRETAGAHDDLVELEKALSVTGRLVSRSGGGSAANTVCVLNALGMKTAFTGCAGNDAYGNFIMASMKGVDLSSVERMGSSSVCLVIMEKTGSDRAMFVAPGSCQEKQSLNVNQAVINTLHISSLAVENGPGLQFGLLEKIEHDNLLFSFDPGEIYASRGLDTLYPLMKRTDILFVTDYELSLLDMDACRNNLFPEWLKDDAIMVKKMGHSGAMVITKSERFHCPALSVPKVVDNTGAGDTFDAGFLNAFMSGLALPDSLEEACRLAAVSLSGYGRSWLDMMK